MDRQTLSETTKKSEVRLLGPWGCNAAEDAGLMLEGLVKAYGTAFGRGGSFGTRVQRANQAVCDVELHSVAYALTPPRP